MDLWIRSQNKEILILAEHLDIYDASVEDEELFVIEESGTDLGSYKTKERALEVLGEIQSLLIESVTFCEFKIDNKYTSRVYEMPKE